ncbi:MAG: hypothetical protein GF317_24410 [Candidatus Lokiarchaeota archaeon]|nr:hypothetical protein [Candidatus Lokiarchaeota archaeon]MBD3202517.1 hypothetical protein [Candidatus Lokiarchaeota archaeon]
MLSGLVGIPVLLGRGGFNPTRLIQILLLGINHIAISIAPFFGLKARGRGSPSKGVRTPEPGPEPDPEPEPSPEPL